MVDISNSYRIRAFLQSLKESILVKKQYNYVFANFVSIINLNRFKRSAILFFAKEFLSLRILTGIG